MSGPRPDVANGRGQGWAAWGVRRGDIILSLQGGLGNQLFQWAFAQALISEGRTVWFDRVRCRGDRPYALAGLVPRSALLDPLRGAALAAAERVGLIHDDSALRLVKQRRSGYDPAVRRGLDGTAYLRGYFQSPMYFPAVADDVRRRILAHLDTLLLPAGSRFAEELRRDPGVVAVHVRRGDYLTDPAAAARHGVLDRGYYDRALSSMADLGYTRRVWFSDDPEWVRTHLAAPHDRICAPGLTSADGGEIALMAACGARIVANSSFSWWGGFLGRPSTPTRPVVAPVVWFAGGHSDARDLIPDGWIRV
ncbi:alpha-1,2-fucosyltransferase [Microbacterium sp. M3]|uniref:Alpha-1,2-fucosyltransferase n=1 Tax=Microbacterium arthrosphaerae TaxID=792652 RepID=A0ABU4H4D8_9MICO|nr:MULTISPECIES: alpha-1,2-fucosyltransferase [Microbacterium]MDW4573607.1 alpha-1,2-fucosyltransferase [Microbacterium arthrosphaerae]MDW7607462.1 alpha-1,2-fucosyltransferase [Microbacterium sp. M3]